MTRFKKELIKRGVRLEETLPWIPYDTDSMTIAGITVNSELCTVTTHYTSIIIVDHYDRNMKLLFTTILE